MKTIKQIADEIGVSKQAVHQKRKNKALSTALQPFTTTVDGVVYVSVDGERLIKQAFGGGRGVKLDDNVYDNSFTVVYDKIEDLSKRKTPNNTLVEVLLKQSEILKTELNIKNKQIEELNERLAESQKLLNQQQQLNAIAEQKIKLIETEKQKKWWQFWKSPS